MSATQRQKDGPRPSWLTVSDWCIGNDIALSRALAAMGFDRYLGAVTRGDIASWPPAYERHSPWRARIGESNTAQGHGFRSGQFTADAITQHDAADAIARAHLGEMNRWRRDASCMLMARRRDNQTHCYWIDTHTMAWRGVAAVASQRGDDLISLGMVMWQCTFPQSAGRIARAIGIDIPRVPNG